jgi:hypothetical protein
LVLRHIKGLEPDRRVHARVHRICYDSEGKDYDEAHPLFSTTAFHPKRSRHMVFAICMANLQFSAGEKCADSNGDGDPHHSPASIADRRPGGI